MAVNTKLLASLKATLDPEKGKTQALDIIGGLFPRKYISLIAAPAGTGKTWLLEKLACDLSVGGNVFNGLSYNEPPRKVLIFSGETGIFLLNRRLSKTNWNFNAKNIIVYSLAECISKGVDLMLNSSEGQANISNIVFYSKPDIVFFDTLISFHTGDENKASDMVPIYSFMKKLTDYYNVACVNMHHTRKKKSQKDNDDTQDALIGSSAGNRLAASVYLVKPQLNVDNRRTKNVVFNVKSWEERIPPFSYEITRGEDGKIDLEINTNFDMIWGPRYKIQQKIDSMAPGEEITAKELGKFGLAGSDYCASVAKELAESNGLTILYDNIKDDWKFVK